jgi:hypothetical protein
VCLLATSKFGGNSWLAKLRVGNFGEHRAEGANVMSERKLA